jgi:hypothetical protein
MTTNLKRIEVKLKETPKVVADILIDFEKGWLDASTLIEQEKLQIFKKLKNELHCRIASLGIDDVEFKIIPHEVISDDGIGNIKTKINL